MSWMIVIFLVIIVHLGSITITRLGTSRRAFYHLVLTHITHEILPEHYSERWCTDGNNNNNNISEKNEVISNDAFKILD